MDSFLNFIFIFILIIIAIRLLFRFLFPIILKSFATRLQRKFQQNMDFQEQPPAKEGEVKIEYAPEKENKIIKDDEGEYVDYEEIEK